MSEQVFSSFLSRARDQDLVLGLLTLKDGIYDEYIYKRSYVIDWPLFFVIVEHIQQARRLFQSVKDSMEQYSQEKEPAACYFQAQSSRTASMFHYCLFACFHPQLYQVLSHSSSHYYNPYVRRASCRIFLKTLQPKFEEQTLIKSRFLVMKEQEQSFLNFLTFDQYQSQVQSCPPIIIVLEIAFYRRKLDKSVAQGANLMKYGGFNFCILPQEQKIILTIEKLEKSRQISSKQKKKQREQIIKHYFEQKMINFTSLWHNDQQRKNRQKKTVRTYSQQLFLIQPLFCVLSNNFIDCNFAFQNMQEPGFTIHSRLILPSISSPTPSPSSNIPHILSILHRRRNEYQQEISRVTPHNDKQSLQYLRSHTTANVYEEIPEKSRDAMEEEFLARGGGGQEQEGIGKWKINGLDIISTAEKSNASPYVEKEKQIETPVIKQPIKQEKPRQRQKTQFIRQDKKQSAQKSVMTQSFLQQNMPSVLPERRQRRQRLNSEPAHKKTKSSFREPQISHFNIDTPSAEQSRFKITPLERPQPQIASVRVFIQAANNLKQSAKTTSRLQMTAKALQSFNPFFRKLQRVISVCLLRIGNLKNRAPQTVLYQPDDASPHFYIILAGRVKLSGRDGMHKICEAGETILEQVSVKGKEGVSLEKARVMQDSWLLELPVKELIKLQKELRQYGFEQGVKELKVLIKRNYVVKNWLRNKFKMMQHQEKA